MEDYMLDKKKALIVAQQIKDDLEKRRTLLDNGHIACHYCDKIVLAKEAVDFTIISITYDSKGRKNKYCSNKCAWRDQMAHEG